MVTNIKPTEEEFDDALRAAVVGIRKQYVTEPHDLLELARSLMRMAALEFAIYIGHESESKSEIKSRALQLYRTMKRAVMAEMGAAVVGQSGSGFQRTDLWAWRLPRAGM